jgi:hypothetical protein
MAGMFQMLLPLEKVWPLSVWTGQPYCKQDDSMDFSLIILSLLVKISGILRKTLYIQVIFLNTVLNIFAYKSQT